LDRPVIRKAEGGERELVPMSWVFVRLQHGYAPKRVTNVRDDQIQTNRFWTPSFQQRLAKAMVNFSCPLKRSPERALSRELHS
jgi:hypothetical protein